MKTENLIPVKDLISHLQIELSFIHTLSDSGLIELIVIEQTPYVPIEQITDLEKMIRLHYDLDINIEGIEVISHLLQRISNLDEELRIYKNKASLFERE